MKKEKSLYDSSTEDLNLTLELDKYKVHINPDSTVATLIFEHLNSKPGFIKHKRSNEKNEELKALYLQALHTAVSKGAPIEIFIAAFSPKVTNPSITNKHIYPDMADLLTLIHLHLVAKGIREIYDYGFRFVIGYRGRVFQDFFGWTDNQVEKSLATLNELIGISEKIVGVRNVVKIVDSKELMIAEGDEFNMRLKNEFELVKKLYTNQDPYYSRKIDAWINDFKQAIDLLKFNTEKEADEYLLHYAIHYRALKNIEYTGGVHNLGICNSFPHALLATIRGIDNKISIQINPFFRLHSHQRLITLSKDSTWESMKWSDMEASLSTYQPVYFKEFDYPFYYLEK